MGSTECLTFLAPEREFSIPPRQLENGLKRTIEWYRGELTTAANYFAPVILIDRSARDASRRTLRAYLICNLDFI